MILTKKTKGVVLILVSALMLGSYGLWSKLIGSGLGVFYQGWSRAVIIALVLFPILYYTKQLVAIERGDWKWMAVFLIFTSATQAPLFYAFTHMDIGTATLLFFVSMLLTMYVVGFGFLGEKFSKVKVASFLIAVAGLCVVFSFSVIAFTFLAAAMAVINGVASGGEVSFSKKLSGQYSTLYLSWLSWIAILITNVPISLVIGESIVLPSLDIVWLWQLGYVAASIFGFWFVMEGLKYTEASIGGLLGLLEVVFSIAFGVTIFGEALSIKIIIGAALILVAAALPHLQELYASRRIAI